MIPLESSQYDIEHAQEAQHELRAKTDAAKSALDNASGSGEPGWLSGY